MQNNISIKCAGEFLELKTALIGGKTDELDEDITAIYSGPLDLNEIHTSLYSAVRAVITLLRQEFGVSIEQIDDFILSAFNEALVKEMNNTDGDKSEIDVKEIVKRYRKNQY